MQQKQLNLDMLNISAYSDLSYARDRELWRGFLSYVLPTVLSYEMSQIEKYLSTAIVTTFEELTSNGGQSTSEEENMRCISMQLAQEIGVPPEFGLASFFEGTPPTRLYKIKSKTVNKMKKSQEEDIMIASWLTGLAKIQSDKKFIRTAEKWRSWLTSQHEKSA